MASRLLSNEPESFTTDSMESFWTTFLKFTKGPVKLLDGMEDEGAGRLKKVDAGLDETVFETSDTGVSTRPGAGVLLDKLELSSSLPTLPHILLKLIDVCGRDDSDMEEIARIAENDPALCTRILRLVNSSCYGLPQKVKTLRQAMTFLGMETVRNIAVSASVTQVFSGLKKDSAFNMKLFWWHSLMCAVLSNLLARKISYSMPDETFLCGLLHDIGRLVMLNNFPARYHELIKDSSSYGELYIEEEKQFGFTHCEAGFNLVNYWKLQPFIADTILYHHEPVQRVINALPLVKIVYVANCLANNTSNRYEVADAVLGLKREDVEKIVLEAQEEVKQTAGFLDIEVEPPGDEPGPIHTDHDEKIQNALASEVRDISLVLGVLQNLINAHDIDSILSIASRGLRIVFNIRNEMFFLFDRSQNLLVAACSDGSLCDGIDDLSIPFQDGKSMLVSALKTGSVKNSFSGSGSGLTIIDEQLIRMMGKQGIICFPMVVRDDYTGVVVIPLDSNEMESMNSRIRLLARFINYIAFSLQAENNRQQRMQDLLAERLAASTAVARKVAHEVNNPLSIIKNYLKILEITLAEENIIVDEIRIINEEIARVSQTIEELSDFSKSDSVNPEEADVNSMLTDIIRIYEKSLSENKIKIESDLDPQLPVVVSDKNHMKKIFINLIKNASEALTAGGVIAVKTKDYSERGFIEVTIRDSGTGLPDVIRSRLFEPYISTKGNGHSGLGLSIVYSSVKKLQGQIDCSTGADSGTTFKITFPMSINNN